MVALTISFLLLAALVDPARAFISPKVSSCIGPVAKKFPFYRKNEHRLLNLFDNDNNNSDNDDSSQPLSAGMLSSVLMPAAIALEDATGGWALEYADLAPETEQTLTGQVFLATNLAYTIMGLCLQVYAKDAWLGTITELASAASFVYHYNQLARPKEVKLVRLTLMVDYVVAAACLGTSSFYLLSDPTAVPIAGYIACALAVLFLGFSWIWEEGLLYCFNHGLWHLFGAYGGYIIGQVHAGNIIA